MAYHTNVYLFLFLPAALVTYQLAPRKRRWMVLLGYSYLFLCVQQKADPVSDRRHFADSLMWESGCRS